MWTSPVRRCVATGRAIAEATGAKARVVEALNDLDYGDWTWLTYEAARATDPDLYNRWYSAPASVRFPGGESLQDLVLRASDALRLAVAQGVGDGRVLVLVTHFPWRSIRPPGPSRPSIGSRPGLRSMTSSRACAAKRSIPVQTQTSLLRPPAQARLCHLRVGAVDVFGAAGKDYAKVGRVQSRGGARTGFFAP